MAVPGDGYARRPPGYRGMVPQGWPSIRPTNGWQPSDLSEAGAKVAFGVLLDTGTVFLGRFCRACNADLGDQGAPRSSSPEGVKAATGKYPEWTLAIPQGGHAPDCPVPYLLRWCGAPESVYTRVRTHDIDDDVAKLVTAAKSPMELAGTDAAQLSEAEQAMQKAVFEGFGYGSGAERKEG